MVVASAPADVVTSPVSAGNCAACNAPVKPVVGSPVALVSVPEDGVPSAPPLTTAAPAVPTFTPSAVATPVPRPLTPVEIGRPVAFVKVTADGIPRFGVGIAHQVVMQTLPVPLITYSPSTPALS